MSCVNFALLHFTLFQIPSNFQHNHSHTSVYIAHTKFHHCVFAVQVVEKYSYQHQASQKVARILCHLSLFVILDLADRQRKAISQPELNQHRVFQYLEILKIHLLFILHFLLMFLALPIQFLHFHKKTFYH